MKRRSILSQCSKLLVYCIAGLICFGLSACGDECSGTGCEDNLSLTSDQTCSASTATKGATCVFGPYEWLVLDKQNNKALLLAKDVLVEKPYNTTDLPVTWASCILRSWLNNEFLNEFTSQEQAKIDLTTNVNENNQWYGTAGGDTTQDRIFLLSLSEMVKYFGDSGQLASGPGTIPWIDDTYNSERIAKYNGSATLWWLRSPGFINYSAAFVSADGIVYVSGSNIFDDYRGVRPALWLNL
ncbi:MAG: DUF6273 domain-containing protein [Myxococcales bacterium]|jgi:hypothetical protein|nr:DUF6273 domain-containing protein [Myxococcales bacterium]